jgi:hypothetical protein
MIRIKRCICLNNEVTDETSSKTNLICVAKEKMFYNLMLSNVILHYILLQASNMKVLQLRCLQDQRQLFLRDLLIDESDEVIIFLIVDVQFLSLHDTLRLSVFDE